MEYNQTDPVNSIMDIFPEEVWELVLEELVDASSISSVFQAFHVIRETFAMKRTTWLIGGIMQHILPKHLSFDDIMSLRLVSRKWKHAVDTCLENHPDHRPFGYTAHTTISETHFNYRNRPAIVAQFPDFEMEVYFNQFMCNMDQSAHFAFRTPSKNPFPGRAIQISIKTGVADMNDTTSEDGEAFAVLPMNKQAETLAKVGHHVWYATFQFPYADNMYGEMLPAKIMQRLFQYLTYLPNLKALKIIPQIPRHYFVTRERLNQCWEFIALSAPSFTLPNLETIELYVDASHPSDGGISSDLHNLLMTSLVGHDKAAKLATFSRYWRPTYVSKSY